MLAATGLFAIAAEAQLAEFNAAYLVNVRKLAAFNPGHPSIQIALAPYLALDGDAAGAVAQLSRLADLGLSFGASSDAAFQSLKDDPGFVAAAQRLAER